MKLLTVGLTDSASSRDALRWAATRAVELGAELHVVTAVSLPLPVSSPMAPTHCFPDRDEVLRSGDEAQGRIVEAVLDEIAVVPVVSRTVRIGVPFDVLRDEAGVADLLVLGHPRRTWQRP